MVQPLPRALSELVDGQIPFLRNQDVQAYRKRFHATFQTHCGLISTRLQKAKEFGSGCTISISINDTSKSSSERKSG